MITLQNSSHSEATILSNLFIDNYMPDANGEFVKVYIYLVRTISGAPVSFSLEQMADHLLCAEKDILRALKYWSKVGLLSLSYDTEKHLDGITLCAPEAESKNTPVSTTSEFVPPAEHIEKKSSFHISRDRIRELKQNEEIVQLLYIAEQYLGKALTATEMQKILYFYDELKMSAELIEYLIEYCVEKNKRSIRYMETVALAWVKDGITTVEEAKSTSALYGKDYFLILKALGITGVNPVADQITYMDTWMQNYGFTLDIIQEACSRTVLKTGQPSFQYADGILKDWKKHNVHSLKDIQLLDDQHKKVQPSKTQATTVKKPSTTNRFNNFPQHEYNYDEIERRLLNR